MFFIDEDKIIHLTRGDIASIEVGAQLSAGEAYTFKVSDVVRFKAFEKGKCDIVVLQKDVVVKAETPTVTISLTKEDTKIGKVISKKKDYWYEIELNPDTAPQTIVGYDDDGAKILRLYPEGSDVP